jgi:murein DD-endopeptidase MepM/ murein hydrolase activator NlpD
VDIILVSGASARARTLSLDWRHGVVVALVALVLLVVFTLAFNFLTLKWAAAVNHPWLQAIVLADQREEAQRAQEKIQAHLNAMALKLGDLEAQVMRLDHLGDQLAGVAGLKPQELPAKGPAPVPGRGGAQSTSMPARDLSVEDFNGLLDGLGRKVEERADQLSVLEALLIQSSASLKFLPSHSPINEGWYSSNFGYRIDPFSGQQTYHEGVDFPAESGTPIVAAASGKVIAAEWHREYGKMIEVDHGNGLVSRYAHASSLRVREGDLVVRGQQIASVGSTGRSTGPHLHFEVRLNGVPQNPARFLQN